MGYFVSGKKILPCAASLNLHYPPKQRVNLILVRTLATHYAVNRNKVIQFKFQCSNEKVYNFLGRTKVSTSLMTFADFKYPRSFIIRTDSFRHTILQSTDFKSYHKRQTILIQWFRYFQTTPTYINTRFHPSQFPHCSTSNAHSFFLIRNDFTLHPFSHLQDPL